MGDDLIEHPRDAQAGEAGVNLHRQALARVSVDHVEYADRAAGSHHIMYEIERPFLVGASYLPEWRARAHSVFTLLPTQHQPGFAIDAMHALVVDLLIGLPQ